MQVPECIGLDRVQPHRPRLAQPVTPILAGHAGIVDRSGNNLVRLAIAHKLAARNGDRCSVRGLCRTPKGQPPWLVAATINDGRSMQAAAAALRRPGLTAQSVTLPEMQFFIPNLASPELYPFRVRWPRNFAGSTVVPAAFASKQDVAVLADKSPAITDNMEAVIDFKEKLV